MHRLNPPGYSRRLLHIGRKAGRLTATKSSVTPAVAETAQTLRVQLQQPSQLSEENTNCPTETLVALANAVASSPDTARVPLSVFRLITQALDQTPNYKGQLSPDSLQLIFRAVAKETSQVQLATKLYLDIYRHSKLSYAGKLENGLYYYELLRKNGLCTESQQLIRALFKDNAPAVNDTIVSDFLDATSRDPDASGYVAVIEAWSTTTPSETILNKTIELVLKEDHAVENLDRLANHLFFLNPHVAVPEATSVLLLDSFLQLPLEKHVNNGGQQLLKVCLNKVTSETSLEVLELLLMSCIHFQEPVSLGTPVYDQLVSNWSKETDFTKETWDVVCQWMVYRSVNPSESLVQEALVEMPPEFVDSRTLSSVLTAASEKAQCSESQIMSLVTYFTDELGVTLDAASYEIIIRRALQAVEVEKAQTLFLESNVNWNEDENKHAGVLNDLLVALCHTTSIPRQSVVDTYQRVRLFIPRLSREAQLALLEMYFGESGDSTTPVGMLLIDQYGETPNLPFELHRDIYELFYHRIMASVDDEEAWAFFGILNCTIKLPYESYYPLQLKLCSLGRPDAAHLIFRHIRSRAKAEGLQPPDNEMYLMLFREYTKWRYELGIHELETYFRMDLHNEMSVAMMNRMLAAYAAIEDGHKVSYLWTEALALPRGGVHGPNQETLSIMMAFFSRSLGIESVDELWSEIPSKFRLRPSAENLRQYLIANCYSGYYNRALEALEMAPKEYGIPITGELLQTLYNWTLLPNRKEKVKEFAMKNFPREWELLESTPGALKSVVLPSVDSTGHDDEASRRLAAVQQLENEERQLSISHT